jgi:hypothetical protein
MADILQMKRKPDLGPGRLPKAQRAARSHASTFPQHIHAQVMLRTSPSQSRGRRECRMQAAPMARLQQKKQEQSGDIFNVWRYE